MIQFPIAAGAIPETVYPARQACSIGSIFRRSDCTTKRSSRAKVAVTHGWGGAEAATIPAQFRLTGFWGRRRRSSFVVDFVGQEVYFTGQALDFGFGAEAVLRVLPVRAHHHRRHRRPGRRGWPMEDKLTGSLLETGGRGAANGAARTVSSEKLFVRARCLWKGEAKPWPSGLLGS